MRGFFRFVLMAMVLIVVALMSALTAMRIAIHGRETTVPNFVKLSPPEAARVALQQGLEVAMEGQFYSADIPEGRVVSQTPPPGTRVRRGWRVRLAESLGPQRVTIPDVVGESPRAAELNMRQRGLEIDTVAEAHLPDSPTEQIVAQSPPANATGIQSPKMSVLIAAPPSPVQYVMPNFVGHPITDATAEIEQAGFKITEVRTVTAPATANGTATPRPINSIPTITTIVAQTPAAGQTITADTPIFLDVTH